MEPVCGDTNCTVGSRLNEEFKLFSILMAAYPLLFTRTETLCSRPKRKTMNVYNND